MGTSSRGCAVEVSTPVTSSETCGQFSRLEIIVNDGGDGDLIAGAEEARNGQADHQVFANEHAVHRPSGAGVDGHGADSSPPCGQANRGIPVCGGFAGGIGPTVACQYAVSGKALRIFG